MSLEAALIAAQSGLTLVNRQIAAASSNIANAGTAGATRKTVSGSIIVAGDSTFGVRTGEVKRAVDDALLAGRDAARSAAAGAKVREALLQTVEAAQGTPGQGGGVGDLTAALDTAFTALADNPADTIAQTAVVTAAQDLVTVYHDISQTIGDVRQQAQDGIVSEVAALNDAVREVSSLTVQIRTLQAQGASTAALEDQRDAAISRISESVEVKALHSSDGGVTLIGRNGVVLPLDPKGDLFTVGDGTVSAGDWYGGSGSLPGIHMGGVDVTQRLIGGRLAEYVTLRDTTLPRMQAELDVAAGTTASRLEAQGLRLFTNAAGTVPDLTQPYASSGLLGFASAIQVNADVVANPGLVRDGTHAVANGAGGATGFTPNPAGGPAAFSTLITRITDFAFGTEVSAGVTQPAFVSGGLGPDGTLTSSIGAARSLLDYTSRLTASQTAERTQATAAREQAEGLEALLDDRFAKQSGVDTDTELASMVNLQTAYAANARVLSAVQQMFDTLFAAVK